MKATAKLKTLAVAASFMFVSALAGAATLTQGDADYVGLINDNIPSSPSDEMDNINGLIQVGAGLSASPCPAPSTEATCDRTGSTLDPLGGFDMAVDFGAKDESGGTTINLTDSFQYILGKYDAGQAGALVWYFANGITGEITLPSELNGFGLSHISWYNITDGGGDDDEIPEPGSLALLGLGLLAAAGVRRRRLS